MRLFENDGRDFERLRRDFRWRVPDRYNMGVDVGDRHASRGADTALFLEDAEGREQRLSFADLKRRSDALSAALTRMGLARGDRVGIIAPQRVETALAHVALWKAGCISLPLSVLFGPDALRFRLADSGARAVIADRAHLSAVEGIRDELPALEFLIDVDGDGAGADFWELADGDSAGFRAMDTQAGDPALLIYTSGTTGAPKGALLAHRGLLGNLSGFELSHDFFPEPGDCMWTPADWAWTGGLLDVLLPALRYGVAVVGSAGRFDATRAFELMEKYRVRNAFIPPTAMKMLMQVPDAQRRFEVRLRSVMSAGEQVGAEVLRYADEVLRVPVNEMWGQTEFNYIVGNCRAIMPARAGSMGKPYPGHDVAVVDEHGEVAADGEVGELVARRDDPVFFLGYWRREDATREKYIGEYWSTGDMGYRDADGYLWFVGRKDDVISTAGHRVGPGEIEDCLLHHPAVAQAAVIGAPDALRGEIIKAFIVLADGHRGDDTLVRAIQDQVKTRLAAHEYPREIEFIDELPLTTTGKVRRSELRQREIAQRSGRGDP
jgi:acetyl-CoA synthetase